MYELELFALGYLGISAVVAAALWLLERRRPKPANDDVAELDLPWPVALVSAGLAWPIALPLTAFELLRQTREARRRRKLSAGS